MKKNRLTYLSAMTGAAAMMLLRIFDRAGSISIVLVIVGLTAFLTSVRHAGSKKNYLCIAGMTAAAYVVRCYGYTGEPAADILLGCAAGLIMFVLLCVERIFKKYEDFGWYTLIFPAVYLLFMYFTETVKVNMPFRLDAYFSCMPVLCQITALLGIYSLDFLLGWTASVLAFLTDHRPPGRKSILSAAYAVMLAGIIGFGIWHMDKMNILENAKSDTVRVGCATGPYYGSLSAGSYTDLTLEESMASLTGIVEDAAEKNVEILVFSEEAYCITDQEEDTLTGEAKKLAAENNMHMLLAYEVEDTDGSEDGKTLNKLCWISSEGEVIYDYTKHCIIPLVETEEYVRGDRNIEPFIINVHGKTLKAAAAICYDGDYDFFMSHMGKNVDLLLVPTWDWKAIAEEHFSVARLRAISAETTLIRSVYDGWSAVIDSTGSVLLRENTNETGYENVLVYDVPVR